MNLTRLALVMAMLTTVFWTAKAIAIAIAGGLDLSPLEGPLFLLGMLACLVTAAVTGMALAQGRGTLARVLAAVAGVAAAAVFGAVVSVLVSLVEPAGAGWVWGEINLWVLMLALLGLTAALHARSPDLTPAHTVPHGV